MAKGKKDIEVGINVVQPTEEKLTLLGKLKTKVPNLIKGKEEKKKATVAKSNKPKGATVAKPKSNKEENEK